MESYWAPTVFNNKPPHPRQVRFEAKRVRDLLDTLGLGDYRRDLIRWHEDYYGVPRLTFEAFHEAFPTFPYLLEAQSFFNTFPESNTWSRVGTWIGRFHQTFVVERYGLLLDRQLYFSDSDKVVLRKPLPDCQRELPVAMAFPWQGVKGGLVVHAGPPLTESGFYHDIGHAGRVLRLHVERYARWVDAVAQSGWTPDRPPAPEPGAEGYTTGGPLMNAELLEVCGRDPRDAWLLSWLLWATGPRATDAVRARLVRVDGRPHLATTHDQIAGLTGLSVQQVRDGLEALNRRGFVSRVARGAGRRTHVWVDRDAIVAARSEST
jgi:hypothetical protein